MASVPYLKKVYLEKVVPELKRVRRDTGAIVLVEETDGTLEAGKAARAELGYTKGRTVATYAELMAPLTLVHTQPRRIEPTYERPDVGTYMLFR